MDINEYNKRFPQIIEGTLTKSIIDALYNECGQNNVLDLNYKDYEINCNSHLSITFVDVNIKSKNIGWEYLNEVVVIFEDGWKIGF